jgi:carbamoyl-phosphate synthase small subunit
MQSKAQQVDIVLEHGGRFAGRGFGDFSKPRGAEFVFCTAMSGIEESLTDPSFARQALVTTTAHVGNTGFTGEDRESTRIWVEGLISRNLDHEPSNWRSKKSISDWLVDSGSFAVEGIDTRELTFLLRTQGSQRGVVAKSGTLLTKEQISQAIDAHAPKMEGLDLTSFVSCKQPYLFQEKPDSSYWPLGLRLSEVVPTQKPLVAVWDYGIKTNTLRILDALGCQVQVLPASTKAEDILNLRPKGILLSNGPGDPAAATHSIGELKKILGRIPVFGICLGHQLMAHALGAKTFKMPYGHRGIHHPVVELDASGQPHKTWITSQNHGFAVDVDSLTTLGQLWFVHADDSTVEGVKYVNHLCQSVQFHPEAAPGPTDTVGLLANFVEGLKA